MHLLCVEVSLYISSLVVACIYLHMLLFKHVARDHIKKVLQVASCHPPPGAAVSF